jgi:hypothetical protein
MDGVLLETAKRTLPDNARKPSGDFSDVGWFAIMSVLVVVLTMMLVAISAGTTP